MAVKSFWDKIKKTTNAQNAAAFALKLQTGSAFDEEIYTTQAADRYPLATTD